MKSLLFAFVIFASASSGYTAPVSLTDNANFELFRDDGPASSTYRPSGYSVLRVKLELEGSPINDVERKKLIARILSRFANKTTGSTFIVTVNDQPPIPLYTLLKDASDSQLSPIVGWRRISSPRVFSTVDKLNVKVSVHFSDTMTSSIAADAQTSISAVTAVIGAFPASIAISKIPPSAIKGIDDFIVKMNSADKKLAPEFEITGSQLGTDFEYKMIFFDGPKGAPGRMKLATLLFNMEHFPSLFFAQFPLTDAGNATSLALIHKGIDGKTEKESATPTSVHRMIRDDSAFTNWKAAYYAEYLQFCHALPNLLGGFGFSTTDLLLQEHAFLNLAPGGAKRTGGAEVCPNGGTLAGMDKLGLPKLSVALPIKPGREEVRTAFDKLATVLARGAGFAEIAMGSVLVRQTVPLFPSEQVALNTDVTRGGDEIEEFFSGFAPLQRVRISKFDFTGEGSYSGSANLRIENAATTPVVPTRRMRVRVLLDEELLVKQLYIDAMP